MFPEFSCPLTPPSRRGNTIQSLPSSYPERRVAAMAEQLTSAELLGARPPCPKCPYQPHAFKSHNNNFCTTPKNPEITASKGLPPTCGPLRARCRPSRPTLAMAGHETCARRAWCVFRVMESRLRSEIS